MPQTYSPRFSRKDADRISFAKQPRDDRILQELATYRFLTVDLIAKLMNESPSAIQHRLQRLYKHGYLKRMKTGSPKIVYAPAWLPRSKNPQVDHDLMAARFWVTLELATRSRNDIGYEWTPGWVLRSQGNTVIPDAELFLFYDLPDGRRGLSYKLECDQATESPARIADKCQAYLTTLKETRAIDPQIKPFRVLFVTTTTTRVESIRKGVLKHIGPQAMFLFTHERMYTPDRPESILSAVWQTVVNGNSVQLLPDRRSE